MVFNRKRKDNRSNSFILDDSPKRTKVQAQRKFAQGSNVNSPVLTPVKELEKSEKVIPEPIELLPMKRPNTEDFLTFLCFRGTPVLPPNLSFFNNASMVERNQSSESTSTSPKNGVILPSISKTPGERPFIAFGVRKRADPIVVSRHMDKKRRHALALQALRRKYQEQKMAKIRAITISKLSEKVQTNKTVVRTTRSVTKAGPITKKNIAQKTKITVVATKVTTRRTSTLKQPVRTSNIKPKMCLRSYRGRFVQRELLNKPVKKRPMPKKVKVVKKDEDKSDEEEEEEEEEFTSGDDEPLLQKSIEGEKIARKTASIIPKKPTDKGFHKTRSNVIANQKVTRRHPAQTRLLVRAAQSKLKSPPNSPRLRSQQLKRNVKLIQTKKEVKTPIKKQIEITKKLEIKKNTITNKPLEGRNVKVLKTRSESLKKNIVEGTTKNKLATSNENIKGKLRKPANKTNKVNVAENDKKAVKPMKKKVEVTKKQNECDKKPCEETGKSNVEEDNKKLANDDTKSKVKEISEKKAEVNMFIEKNQPDVSEAQDLSIKENQSEVVHSEDAIKMKAAIEKSSKEIVMIKEKKDESVSLQEVCDILKDTKLDEPKKKVPHENAAKKKSLEQSARANLLLPEELKKVTKELKLMFDETNLKPVEISKVSTKLLKNKVASNETETKTLDLDLKKLPQRPSRKTKEAAAIYMEILGHKLVNKDDIDEDSMDSFPELPNVRKTEQRENELKAKAKEDNAKKRKSKSPAESDGDNSSKVKRSVRRTRISKAQLSSEKMSSDSDESFTAEVTLPTEKQLRPIRNKSPKLYRSFSDTDSETLPLKKTHSTKRKSENMNSESDSSKRNKRKQKRVAKKQSVDSFSESDEEPLAKLTQKKSEDQSKKTSVRSKGSQQETATVIVGKQKRECTKRPQNYMPYSSSDEEEKLFLGFDKAASPPKPVEPTLDLLCTKDMGRRYGKERVNMSNEQIEKWLNDSALAGMSLIKKENDEMLKFGEKIPTETNLENSNMSSINTESLKSTMLVPKCNMEKIEEKKEDNSLNSTPEKYSTASLTKPLSNERKPIFTKKERHSTDVPPKNINAFSVCNESSVYAFADTEDSSVNTPFRRPSRRPSSTATSKSEDDPDAKFRLPNLIKPLDTKSISKEALFTDESNTSCTEIVETVNPFYIPQQPKKIMPSIKSLSTPMFPPSQTNLQKRDKMPKAKSVDRLSETSEDFKYKVPSSPSASSSSSAKLYKRQTNKNKQLKVPPNYMPVNTTEFPELTGTAQIVEAPVFHPTEKEFIDPIEYIEKIRNQAEKFGVCRIVPPANFKPECKVLDEMRFTAYNQYVHKMMHRWGPNFKELVAIRKYLATQSINLKHPPWIGGMEIDLPRLYQTVQTLGGLKEVIEKKKWPRVSELMKIPKSAQDRVTKLDDIYCKYLLPYDTLSPDERDKLFDAVETEWAKRESKNLLRAQGDEEKSDEEEESEDEDETDIECIVKGRSMALSAFYRIARNTMAMWFKTPEAGADEVEEEFWNHVTSKQFHICVHSGSIDSGNWGYGFAVSKNSPFARHAWNLKVLTNNSGSILRSMGPVMGLTVPTLHVGMVFSGCCWYRDPHSLPWIEYCHTGANKIWYGIPDSMSEKFHETLLKLVPNYCLNKSLWLPSDTAMLPPNLLVDNGVSLTRTVQEPGQFVVIFPKAFTSNICTGYVVSESVFFAQPDWLNCARKVFEELRNSCEPSMFSYERLVLSVATDVRSDISVLRQIIPAVEELCRREIKERQRLKELGVIKEERLPLPDVRKKKKVQNDTETEYACEDCRWNLFCSMVFESQDNAIYCIEHAINHIEDKSLDSTKCKLMYTYDLTELSVLPDKVRTTIETKLQKKAGSKFTGMATLLNR